MPGLCAEATAEVEVAAASAVAGGEIARTAGCVAKVTLASAEAEAARIAGCIADGESVAALAGWVDTTGDEADDVSLGGCGAGFAD